MSDYVIRDSIFKGHITFNVGGDTLMRLAPDGFYVRGVKVEQGPGEAEAVYSAFLDFLRGHGLYAPLSTGDGPKTEGTR